MVPTFRITTITWQMGKFDKKNVHNYIDRKLAIGDWFLLYQIGKNMDKHAFRLFLESISQPGGKSQPKLVIEAHNDIELQAVQNNTGTSPSYKRLND